MTPSLTERYSLPLDRLRQDEFDALLGNIQGNIVRGHGRDLTRLMLFRFQRKGRFNRALFAAAVTRNLITTAAKQKEDAKNYPAVKNARFFSLGITNVGMQRCGYRLLDLPWSGLNGFATSMRAQFQQLGDASAGMQDSRPVPDWESAYITQPHGVWLLANDDPTELDRMQADVEAVFEEFKIDLLETEDGIRWKDRDDPENHVREPFGFLDGLSQPEFFDGPAFQGMPPWVKIPLSRVLFNSAEGSLHDGGSFLVLRKLEQDVKAFRDFEAGMAVELAGLGAGVNTHHAGTLLVGRDREGQPLAHVSDGAKPNDFHFGRDASRCPFHAHIRKANPRVPLTRFGNPVEAQFVRRSMVYDRDQQLPPMATADYAEGASITKDVGLLFMGYMSDIGRQFMAMQQNWFANPTFPVNGAGFGDPLLRPHVKMEGSDAPLPWSWSEQGLPPRGLPEFVRAKGGAFFYVPPIAWLNAQTP